MSESGLDWNYDPFLDGFEPEVVRTFARVGIYPPPYCGGTDPESVLFLLSAQERWLDPPCLVRGDEAGVCGWRRGRLSTAALTHVLRRTLSLRRPDLARGEHPEGADLGQVALLGRCLDPLPHAFQVLLE